MKSNELMIGDWVKCGKRYMKVTQLAEDMDCNDIEPIPLTQEILEKNGFEKWDDGWCVYHQENTGIEIVWVGTILKIGGQCGNLELPNVMYVHQLQHALKLCGIEKEIEL